MEEVFKSIKEQLRAASINLGRAIDIINKAEEAKCGDCSRCSWYQKGITDAEQDKWIWCSDRMPNEEYEHELRTRGRDASYPVFVTAKAADGKFYVTQAWYLELFLERNFYTADLQPLDVVAWQLLPKPCTTV